MPQSFDQIFREKKQVIDSFQFNRSVAQVFDDMVSRSIPFYHEIHRILIDLLRRAYKGGKIIDLGCSTGETLKILAEQVGPVQMVGIDNSEAMLEEARNKLSKYGQIQLVNSSILEAEFFDAGFVIMNYTLQFIDPRDRGNLLKKIYSSLRPGGFLFVSEKIKSPQGPIENLVTDLYYDFKRRNGYSELEIAQKREALENVLIPLTPQEQMKQLKEAGFQHTEMIFRWYNFASYLAIKSV